MAWYYRKRIKIFPGVHLNFSKSGISTSIGPKGAKVNIGPKGSYIYTSIPGTGLYSRQKLVSDGNKKNKQPSQLQEINEPVKREGCLSINNSWGCCFRWFGLISFLYVIFCLIQMVFGHFDNTNDDAFQGALLIVFLFILVYHKLFIIIFSKLYSIIYLQLLSYKIKKKRNNISRNENTSINDATGRDVKNATSAAVRQILRDILGNVVK